MQIYVYAEHHSRKGQVVLEPEAYIRENGIDNDDIWLWGCGKREDLAAGAQESLDSLPADNASSAYYKSCLKNVLAYLS